MTPTKVLFGQILVVFSIVVLSLSLATQWTAASLGYQASSAIPGPCFTASRSISPGVLRLVVRVRRLRADVFSAAPMSPRRAASLGALAAMAGSVWRARQAKLVTTYGSARWATARDLKRSGMLAPPASSSAARTSTISATTAPSTSWRSRRPARARASAWSSRRCCRGPARLSSTTSRARTWPSPPAGARVLALPATSTRPTPLGRLQPAARGAPRRPRGPRRPEHRRRAGRSRRRAGAPLALGEDQPLAAGRRHPPHPLRRPGQDALRRRQLPVRPARTVRAHAAS